MISEQNAALAQVLVKLNRLTPQQANVALGADNGELPLHQLLVNTKQIRTEAARPLAAYGLRLAEGELLVSLGIITRDTMEAAMLHAGDPSDSLSATLMRKSLLTPEQVKEAITAFCTRDFSDLAREDVHPLFLELIPPAVATKYLMIPLARIYDRLIVATPRPKDLSALDDVRLITGLKTVPVPTPEATYASFWKVRIPRAADFPAVETETVDEIEDLGSAEADAPPIILMVNEILGSAIRTGVSDIHIEPKEKQMLVRYRKDGILAEAMRIPKGNQSAIIARIKIMSDLNVSEKRLPQDGKVRVRVDDNQVDLRVSTMPSQFGEKIVIRVLNRNAGIKQLVDLGFTPKQLEDFERCIASPQGIFFVTGPTGSGKTTTLYSALGHLQKPSKNIITIEDPIEYNFEHATQVQVQAAIELTFARVLRAVLRQDPDIVLIGETRDHETAKTATEAALTGHLVLTSLHTNDATGAITRLVEMGIEPYLIGSAMLGAIAQRLIRKICPECREEYRANPEILAQLGLPEDILLSRGKGCEACKGTGYAGRRAIYEVFVVSEDAREMIVKGLPSHLIRLQAAKEGMMQIRQHAIELVREGITTFEELVRVVYSDHSTNEHVCPRCRNAVEEGFSNCPFCKYQLNPSCPSCASPAKPEWSVCPKCGEHLQLVKQICKSCMAELEPSWVRCPFCFFEDSLLV